MRVGIPGDLHAPFTHPLYLKFCQDVFSRWRINHVHFIGDIVDQHALGFWDHDPDGHSASREADLAHRMVAKWYKAFPKATVSIGNHDERQFRRAFRDGVPRRYLKAYKEVWETPQWDWQFSHTFDDVGYTHGTRCSGKDGAFNLALQRRRSTVIGHIHSYPGVKWHANEDDRIFGMNVGCGVFHKAYTFGYGRDSPVREVLGCGVVIDGTPYFEPMPMSRGEKYHRSRAA